MTDHLSPEARKAMQASEIKRRSYWPGLARQGDKLILTHPHRGGYKHKADLAKYVKEKLPELQWDSKRGHWQAPLDEATLGKVLNAFTQANEVQLNMAKSLTDDDTVALIVQYEASKRYLRSGGQLVGVQRNGDKPRPPKGSVSPNEAGRTLESRGYEFAGSEWLDRDTFRPRQKWVFKRLAVFNLYEVSHDKL